MSSSPDADRRRRRRDDDETDEETVSKRHSDRKYDERKSTQERSRSHRSERHESDDKHRRSRGDREYRDEDRSRQNRESRKQRDPEEFYRDMKNRDRSRSRDRSDRHQRRSRSPPPKRRRRSESISRSPPARGGDRRSRAPLPSQDQSFRGEKAISNPDGKPPLEKEKPNYKPTGLLAKEANTVAGTTTVLKYHEPPEARKPSPKDQWRMYVFKSKDLLDTIYLYQRSVWLLGRDETVTDVHLEHPSISKQHAVVQFRYLTSTNEFGDKLGKVKPYLIDLESANGTKLNGKRIEGSRYVELVDGDVVGFGESEREYVLMLPPVEK